MARPKRRRNPKPKTVFRIPVFEAVARPEPLPEDRGKKWPEGTHRPFFEARVEGVGEATFLEANRHRPDAEQGRMHRYERKLELKRIEASECPSLTLAQFARNAVELAAGRPIMVWTRAEEMRAIWANANRV